MFCFLLRWLNFFFLWKVEISYYYHQDLFYIGQRSVNWRQETLYFFFLTVTQTVFVFRETPSVHGVVKNLMADKTNRLNIQYVIIATDQHTSAIVVVSVTFV